MKNVIIAAGGTGGHINAAISLGEVLKKNNNVIYITGTRHLDYKLFKDLNVLHLNVRPLRVNNPINIIINTILNVLMFFKVFLLIISKNPRFIIGCGGYVCGPVLLAGYLLFKKLYVIEQNAIAGLTNKLLSRISSKNFLNFKETKGIENNVIVSGNPVRSKIQFKEIVSPKESINILVFGGSLGASQINEVIFKYAPKKPENINIRHQVGKDNLKEISIKGYEQKEYLENIQNDYEWAHIIVSRAGASTISELEIIQKPTILIPYPAAVDNHQYYNALALKNKVSFYVKIIDHTLEKDNIANELIAAIDEIKKLNAFVPIKVASRENAALNIVEVINRDAGL